MHAPYQTNRRTDRRTDEHHANSATIGSNERIGRYKLTIKETKTKKTRQTQEIRKQCVKAGSG